MPKAYVNIGSNKGDRLAQIERAVAAIRSRLSSGSRVSKPFYSSPQGFESENCFVNVGVVFESELDPFELFRILQKIEKEIDPSPHRDNQGNYIDRAIDIDFISYGEWHISSPILELPHPRMAERDFVLIPLKEIS